jgi:hypothetical protein
MSTTIYRIIEGDRVTITLGTAHLTTGTIELAGQLIDVPEVGRCGELTEEPVSPPPDPHGLLGPLHRCGRPGQQLIAAIPEGERRPVQACYCDLHGGAKRACAEVLRDWAILAPATVRQVQDAGCAALCTENVVIVIRELAPEPRPTTYRLRLTPEQFGQLCRTSADARELVRLGLAHCPGYPRTVPTVEPAQCRAAQWEGREAVELQRRIEAVRQRWGLDLDGLIGQVVAGGLHARRRPWDVSLGLGSHAVHVGTYTTAAEAEQAGRAAWRARLDHDVQRIRELRGGTLGWGLPVQPATDPMIVRPRPGECGWDAYARERATR